MRYLSYTNKVNDIGFYELRLDMDDDKVVYFSKDYMFEVWRKADGEDWQRDYVGLHRRKRKWINQQGYEYAGSIGRSLEELLARRLIEPSFGNDFASKAGYAAVIMSEYVDENAGPGVLTYLVDRGAGVGEVDAARQVSDLTVATASDIGAAVTRDLRLVSLSDALQELARAGGVDYWLEYQTTWEGPHAFEFQCTELRGTDRRIDNTDGNLPLVFSVGRGTMVAPVRVWDALNEQNFLYVGGPGKGADRLMNWIEDSTAEAETRWNRREAFIDARNQDTLAKLASKGEEELEARGEEQILDFDIIETAGCKYGRDWELGDLVSGIFDGEQQDVRIVAVTVSVRKDMGEDVKVKLEVI